MYFVLYGAPFLAKKCQLLSRQILEFLPKKYSNNVSVPLPPPHGWTSSLHSRLRKIPARFFHCHASVLFDHLAHDHCSCTPVLFDRLDLDHHTQVLFDHLDLDHHASLFFAHLDHTHMCSLIILILIITLLFSLLILIMPLFSNLFGHLDHDQCTPVLCGHLSSSLWSLFLAVLLFSLVILIMIILPLISLIIFSVFWACFLFSLSLYSLSCSCSLWSSSLTKAHSDTRPVSFLCSPSRHTHLCHLFWCGSFFSLCFLSFLWVATVSWVENPFCVSRLSNLSSQCLRCLAVVRILWHLSKESADRARQIKMFKHYNALKWEVWWFSNFLIIQITHFIPWHHHDYWVILLIISILLVILPSSTLLSRPLVGWYLVPPNLTADAPIWLLRFTIQHCSVATAEHEDWQALESTCKISSNGWTRGQQNLSLYLVIQWRLIHNDKSNEMILIIIIAELFFFAKIFEWHWLFFSTSHLWTMVSVAIPIVATNCLSCATWFWQSLHTSSQFSDVNSL